MNKITIFLFFSLIIGILSSCQDRFHIGDAYFKQAWQEYQILLFQKGWEEEITVPKRIALLQEIGKKYKIPGNRMTRYVHENYKEFYEKSLKLTQTPLEKK